MSVPANFSHIGYLLLLEQWVVYDNGNGQPGDPIRCVLRWW